MARVSEVNKKRMQDDGSWKAFCEYRDFAKEHSLPRPKPGQWSFDDAKKFLEGKSPAAVQTIGQQQTNPETKPEKGVEDILVPLIEAEVKYHEDNDKSPAQRQVEAIRWVATILDSDTIPTAPSAEAYAMFKWASSSSVSKREFWLKMYNSIMPKKFDEEKSANVKDDSAYSLCKIELQLKELSKSGIKFPEGSFNES